MSNIYIIKGFSIEKNSPTLQRWDYLFSLSNAKCVREGREKFNNSTFFSEVVNFYYEKKIKELEGAIK